MTNQISKAEYRKKITKVISFFKGDTKFVEELLTKVGAPISPKEIGISKELFEASYVDGCTKTKAFFDFKNIYIEQNVSKIM